MAGSFSPAVDKTWRLRILPQFMSRSQSILRRLSEKISLGQGGYYSPQEYLSFAVPVTWRQRTENWSWELGGSVSWSHSRTQTQARYPLLNLIPSDYRQRASELTEEGSSSHGFGYTARALVERRVTSNWFVGAAVDIQQAKDYTPSHALLYVRYSAAGWQGDLDMPPQPLVPYADW